MFSHLWRTEWKRQRQAMELRTRVQLHALALDMMQRRPSGASGARGASGAAGAGGLVTSPRTLQLDPRLRRQLLMKLRQQEALDIR